jgi:folylpolyglutamate synthase/dihydropteroate synthase
MLKLLIPYFDKIFLTRHNVLHRKATDLKKMYKYCNQQAKRHQEVKISIDPSDALKTALTLARPDDLILATGSLYLVGYLKKLKTQNAKLKTTTQNLKTSNK